MPDNEQGGQEAQVVKKSRGRPKGMRKQPDGTWIKLDDTQIQQQDVQPQKKTSPIKRVVRSKVKKEATSTSKELPADDIFDYDSDGEPSSEELAAIEAEPQNIDDDLFHMVGDASKCYMRLVTRDYEIALTNRLYRKDFPNEIPVCDSKILSDFCAHYKSFVIVPLDVLLNYINPTCHMVNGIALLQETLAIDLIKQPVARVNKELPDAKLMHAVYTRATNIPICLAFRTHTIGEKCFNGILPCVDTAIGLKSGVMCVIPTLFIDKKMDTWVKGHAVRVRRLDFYEHTNPDLYPDLVHIIACTVMVHNTEVSYPLLFADCVVANKSEYSNIEDLDSACIPGDLLNPAGYSKVGDDFEYKFDDEDTLDDEDMPDDDIPDDDTEGSEEEFDRSKWLKDMDNDIWSGMIDKPIASRKKLMKSDDDIYYPGTTISRESHESLSDGSFRSRNMGLSDDIDYQQDIY